MAAPDRLERLTDLVLVLLGATRPLPLEEIATEIPGYPTSHDARRQAFERDKRLLRDEGIDVAAVPVEGPGQFGYRIESDTFYLPDLALSPEEQTALQLAVAGVHLGDPSGRDALLKLGASGVAETRPVAAIVPQAALVPLFEALRSRAEVTFSYRGATRHVAPAALRFGQGRWYLVGWDLDREAGRTFRVDRIDGSPVPGPSGGATLPEGFDATGAAEEPVRPGEGDSDDAVVLVDAIEAARVAEEVGEGAVVERRPDGSVVLRLGITSTEFLRSWVLGLLDHAELLEPKELRDELVSWLDAIVTLPRDPDGALAVPSGGVAGPPSAAEEPPGATGRDASTRLRRLLAIVSWLARVGAAPIAEVAQRFDIPPDELVRELELAACCGVPPYTPDALMEILVTDDMVEALLPAEMGRPRRLTAAEGFALATSARTILAIPGADREGALAGALAKLDAALGDHQRLVVDLDAPALLAPMRDALDRNERIEIEYYSASSDTNTEREIDPYRVISLDGHWYVDALCQRAGDVRRFRIDRVRSMHTVGPQPDIAAAAPRATSEAFVPGPGAVTVELRLDPEAAWVADSVPVLAVRPEGSAGRQVVTLAVGGTAWLERLLLQLGPHATVLGPSDFASTAADAARRVLARYGA